MLIIDCWTNETETEEIPVFQVSLYTFCLCLRSEVHHDEENQVSAWRNHLGAPQINQGLSDERSFNVPSSPHVLMCLFSVCPALVWYVQLGTWEPIREQYR